MRPIPTRCQSSVPLLILLPLLVFLGACQSLQVNPPSTPAVDVIGTSMGGLVARYAALDIEGKPRLNVSKLFTIATPHLGADLAELPSFNQLHLDMRKGAVFIAMIRESESEID